MSISLQVSLVAVSIVLLVIVLRLIASGRLQLRYALLWLVLGAAIVFCSLFPDVLFSLNHIFGFEAPSNLVFAIGLFFLLLIVLTLSVVLSRQAVSIKNLTQRIALLEHELIYKNKLDN